MTTSRLITVGGFFLSFAAMLAGGCSSASKAGSSNGSSTGGTLDGMHEGGGPTVVLPNTSGVAGGLGDNLNPLCGIGPGRGTCLPDNASACRDYVPPKPSGVGGDGAGRAGGGRYAAASGGAGGAGVGRGGAAAGGAPDNAGGAG